jgi:hypothetical protein
LATDGGALTQAQTATLDAIAARLIPTDDNGPGAREAMAVRYVLRSLASDYEEHRAAYVTGLAAVDSVARSRYTRAFAALTEDEQDSVLTEIERGVAPEFFELVRRHVIEGMFGDPRWGGNAGQTGWTLLGYPGPRLVWTEEEQRLDSLPQQGEDGSDRAQHTR